MKDPEQPNQLLSADFEKEPEFKQLLPARSVARVQAAVEKLGLECFCLVDVYQNIVIGQEGNFECTIALVIELEPIGFIKCRAIDQTKVEALKELLIDVMQTNWRYQMASSLHIQTIQQDFNALIKKHHALEVSEQKFKDLSSQLEHRVAEQVKTIEDSQRKLYEAEKMSSVGQLASGVAHEINNPIGFINSNLRTAQDYLIEIQETVTKIMDSDSNLDQQAQKNLQFLITDFSQLLEESRSGALRVASIVADLKAFSNVDYSELTSIDLNESIAGVIRIFKTSLSKNINVELNLNPLPKICCRVGYINQLVLNLLQNAADAIETSGVIILSSELHENIATFKIEDNGRGMPPDVLKKAFDPFYTTHDVGGGTGLGLTVSRDIIHAHNGEIRIESEINLGTKVTFTIPIGN